MRTRSMRRIGAGIILTHSLYLVYKMLVFCTMIYELDLSHHHLRTSTCTNLKSSLVKLITALFHNVPTAKHSPNSNLSQSPQSNPSHNLHQDLDLHSLVVQKMAAATTEEKYELITRRLQEVLGGDLIKSILAEGRTPKCYWGA